VAKQKQAIVKSNKFLKSIATLVALVGISLTLVSLPSRCDNQSEFAYVGGTAAIHKGCEGKLEITASALVFDCPQGSIAAPYSSIERMEYRSQVSKPIRKMKLNWKVEPPTHKDKHNVYFTVLYLDQGKIHAMVLKVDPATMRPYLAEIDLRTGHRIDVQQYY